MDVGGPSLIWVLLFAASCGRQECQLFFSRVCIATAARQNRVPGLSSRPCMVQTLRSAVERTPANAAFCLVRFQLEERLQ